MKPITVGSKHKYIGHGDGNGDIHTVVGGSENQLVTWSEPYKDGAEVGGYSWMGTASEFLENFEPIKPKKP